jgi:hypothetical protein
MHWLNESYVKQCNTYMWAHERLISYGFIGRFDKLRIVSLLAGLLFRGVIVVNSKQLFDGLLMAVLSRMKV